MILLNYSLE